MENLSADGRRNHDSCAIAAQAMAAAQDFSFRSRLRDERSRAPARINATDVSGNGCYVENMLPFPLGTVLRLEFWLDSEQIRFRLSCARPIQESGMALNLPDSRLTAKSACSLISTGLIRLWDCSRSRDRPFKMRIAGQSIFA